MCVYSLLFGYDAVSFSDLPIKAEDDVYHSLEPARGGKG